MQCAEGEIVKSCKFYGVNILFKRCICGFFGISMNSGKIITKMGPFICHVLAQVFLFDAFELSENSLLYY